MKHFLLLLCCWLPLAVLARAPLEPLQIAEQFVAPAGWPAMKEYLGGEVARQARRQTLGQQLPARLQRVCQLLQQGPTTAVVAVELRDSVSRNDFYLHFSRDSSTWKLQAVRSLAMTHLGAPMLDLFTAMPPAEVAEYNLRHPSADHAFMVGNLRLWMAADADISAHFSRHQTEFQQLLQLVQAGRYFAPDATAAEATREQAANDAPAVHALLRQLFISKVTQREINCGSCLEFVIGGKQHSSVGLLYQPAGTPPLPMHPDHLIVLKPLGKGWYLFKTT
jgi:hypothetical protein